MPADSSFVIRAKRAGSPHFVFVSGPGRFTRLRALAATVSAGALDATLRTLRRRRGEWVYEPAPAMEVR